MWTAALGGVEPPMRCRKPENEVAATVWSVLRTKAEGCLLIAPSASGIKAEETQSGHSPGT